MEELQATVSDEDVKNFSKQIYPLPFIIVYASSHATIFFHLCGAALKELEKKKITLSSLFLEKALLEIRSKIETGRISSVSTPVAAGARTTRSQTGSLPRAQIV